MRIGTARRGQPQVQAGEGLADALVQLVRHGPALLLLTEQERLRPRPLRDLSPAAGRDINREVIAADHVAGRAQARGEVHFVGTLRPVIDPIGVVHARLPAQRRLDG
jgi:hypothetical protein